MEPVPVIPEYYIQETKSNLERWWGNYIRLGGNDLAWFKSNIGPLMMLPSSCTTVRTTYEYKDAKGNWSKPWVVNGKAWQVEGARFGT